MSDKNFAEGIYYSPPHENAPDFVLGKIAINVPAAITWLEANKNDSGWVNMDAKLSKGGKYYVEKDDWKPSGQRSSTPSGAAPNAPAPEDPDDSIPF